MSRILRRPRAKQKKACATMKKLREERGAMHVLEIENMHKSRELEQAARPMSHKRRHD